MYREVLEPSLNDMALDEARVSSDFTIFKRRIGSV